MDLTHIISTIQSGKFVAVTDHENREDEADLVISAQYITVEQMAFMIRYTSGIITVPMTSERLQELHLERIKTDNPANFDTPFTLSVDLKSKTRGGVSAQERVDTIKALIDPKTSTKDLGRPGHVFPLVVHPKGLHARQGHTEAAMELMYRAGVYPAAVLGELMNDDGSMMRRDSLHAFVEKHDIPLCSIESLAHSMQ